MNITKPPTRRNPLAGVKKTHGEGFAFSPASIHGIGETFVMTPERAPGERLQFWLGQACQRAREEAGVSLTTVAAALARREGTVDSFEKGRNWPQDFEATLVVYAQLTGMTDPRDLVRDALRLWYEQGEAPVANPPVGAKASQTKRRVPPLEPRKTATRARRSRAAGGR